MEQHKALNALLESADLIAMLEELTSGTSRNLLSGPGLSGIRITLRTIREHILNSHDTLAQALSSRIREGGGAPLQSPIRESTVVMNGRANPENAATTVRTSLRASLEKAIEG